MDMQLAFRVSFEGSDECKAKTYLSPLHYYSKLASLSCRSIYSRVPRVATCFSNGKHAPET